MLALVDTGIHVAVPFGENTRYDLIVDTQSELMRVQCKTGRLRNGAVCFATASTYGHHPSSRHARRHYLGEIDAFAVFCGETERVYLVPIEHVASRTSAQLRVDPPRNGQRRGIRHVQDFEVARVVCSDSVRASQLQA
jgi:PD-(D/E)XK nuclease superfamily protein